MKRKNEHHVENVVSLVNLQCTWIDELLNLLQHKLAKY